MGPLQVVAQPVAQAMGSTPAQALTAGQSVLPKGSVVSTARSDLPESQSLPMADMLSVLDAAKSQPPGKGAACRIRERSRPRFHARSRMTCNCGVTSAIHALCPLIGICENWLA